MVQLLNILEKGFGKLPPWARVIVYFFILFFLSYLLMAPRYITGQVVAKTRHGGYVPYRGVNLQTRIGGPTMKYQTNDDGDWAIPVISALPGGQIVIQVYHVDAGSWFDVEIPWEDTWRSLLGESFRITIGNEPPAITIAVLTNRNSQVVQHFVDAVIESAQAGQLILPKSMTEKADPIAIAADKKEIMKSVSQSYREAVGKPGIMPSPQWRIDQQSKLTYVERIQLIEKLEKQHQLAIPDEHWQSIATLGELTDYIVKRKVLEKADPERYKIQSGGDWANIDTALPAEQRPQYK